MAKSKAPKKKYQRGKVIPGAHLPIPAKIKDGRETKVLMALTTLESGFYNAQMGLDLTLFLTYVRYIAKDSPAIVAKLVPAFVVLKSIVDREGRTGKWVVTGDERNTLKSVILEVVEYYRQANGGQAIEAGYRSELKLASVLRKRQLAEPIDKSL